MRRIDTIRGFYAVIDREDEQLATNLLSVARVLQVRLKTANMADILRVARMARRLTENVGALLIINDHVDIAVAIDADGVHLGQDDMPVEQAREASAGRLVIGVSTHNDPQVRDAVRAGADYLGFGPVYATSTKQRPDPVVGLKGLCSAVRLASPVPVVAIGGITPVRAAQVFQTGARAACLISAVNDSASPAESAEAVANQYTSS